MSNEQGTGSLTTSGAPVSDADYVQLCRLVIEHAWRTDNGRSDTLHELWAEDGELDLGSTTLRGRRDPIARAENARRSSLCRQPFE
jgi:hypothetical protein